MAAYTFSITSNMASRRAMTPIDASVDAARRNPLLSLKSEANWRLAPAIRKAAKMKRYSQPHALPMPCRWRRKDVGTSQGV